LHDWQNKDEAINDDQPLENKVLISLLFLELFATFLAFYLLSKKCLWLVELISPLSVLTMCITNTVALLFFFEKGPDSNRYVTSTTVLYYPLLILFCQTDYLTDVSVRVALWIFSRIPIYEEVSQHAFALFIILIVEIPLYYH